MAIISSKSFVISTPQTRAQRGPLIRVKLRDGQYQKLYEQDAIEQGLIPGKKQEPGQDKQRKPAKDKSRKPGQDKSEPADDLTTISGIGPASARLIVARGITTFDELRAASEAGKLDFLSSAVQTAIGKWING